MNSYSVTVLGADVSNLFPGGGDADARLLTPLVFLEDISTGQTTAAKANGDAQVMQ